TIDTTIDQQVAMDEALVPHARRLRIERSNFRLLSDISSKEYTLQLVYDVLRLTPFFKAFLVTADVLEIYMQEFWATATVHHHFIRFKMDSKKHIVNLESFREMLHICPRLPGQSFVEPPVEEEIIAFLRFLGHSRAIRRLTDVEHKDTKKRNEMYYLRFTKVIIHHFMSKDPSIPRRNKVSRHYVRDDHMFTTIKLVSRHQNTQQFGAMLHIELTNTDIRNSDAYKEYYAVATGATPPKTKASVRKTSSSFDATITPSLTTAVGPRLSTSAKGKQPATTSKAKSLSALSRVEMTDAQQLKLATKRILQQTHISHASGFGADEGTGTILGVPDVPIDESEEEISWNSTIEEGDNDDDDDEGDDDDQEDKGNDEDDQEEGSDDEQASKEEEFIHPSLSTHAEEKTRNKEGFDPIPKTPKNTDDEGNCEENLGMNVGREQGQDEEDEEDELYRDVNINLRKGVQMADVQTTQEFKDSHVTLTSTLEANFSEFMQTNQFARAVSSIPGIVQRYMDQRINEAVKVKEQVKVQVLKILPKIEQTVNKQLEAEVLTRSSNSSKTSYAVAVDLSEMELKKIVIEKMEGNKSIQRSNEQRNLYKAFVEAYKSDKIILDTYEDTGSKRRREGKEPESASAPKEKATRSAGKLTQGSKSQQTLASESATAEEPIIQSWISKLAKQSDSRSSFNELMDTHVDFSAFLMNQLKVDTLTSELLARPTYKLMKGSCKSLVELELFLEEVYKATTDQLDWVNPEGTSSRKYTTSITKTKAANHGHIKWIEDLESARDVYSKHRIIAVTELKIVEWHNYKHLDWIMVCRDDDKVYKFKEGDFKRLCIQDIEDMLLLLVQGKLTNLTVKECFTFNVSLRMFTRSIVIQRRVEDLQLGVKSYQKKPNLTKPDTYRSDLKHKEAYIAYSNLKGFIYQNKDKQNRLMRIDELHKFSDRMLIDVRTALDNRLKGIRMKYLPKSIWRKSDKDRAAAMIQAINKMLKTRRIMRSLERFVGGRLYEGDFRSILTDLQVTPTKPKRMTKPYSSHRFIANCFNAGNLKMEVKVPGPAVS
nr:hypothetical protein [Tanacetum cinerariifolium]